MRLYHETYSFQQLWKIITDPMQRRLVLVNKSDKKIKLQIIDLNKKSKEDLSIMGIDEITAIENNYVYGYTYKSKDSPEIGKTIQLDVSSGQMVEISEIPEHTLNLVALPEIFNESYDRFKDLKRFGESYTRYTISREFHYLQNDHLSCFGYYFKHAGKLNFALCVLDLEGVKLFDKVIHTNLDGLTDENFFLYHDMLIFAEENHTVHVLTTSDD